MAHDHGARRVRILGNEFGGGAEHLLRVIDPDVLRGRRGEADLVDDRALFHGSPTQKPSMLPTRMLATICGGGTTMSSRP
jgi:hypothetical protein